MPSPITPNPESLSSPFHFVAYPGPVANTNLATEGLMPCRRIRCSVAGDLVVKRASDGASVTLPFAAGETMEIQALELVAAGSTAEGLTVFW